MPDAPPDELQRAIAAARAHQAARRDEAQRLESELPALNQRLGAARLRQEHMQRPSTLIEASRQRLDGWLARLRMGRSRS